jgi:hypothetical protein
VLDEWRMTESRVMPRAVHPGRAACHETLDELAVFVGIYMGKRHAWPELQLPARNPEPGAAV